MVKRQCGSAAYQQFERLGRKTSGGRLFCADRSGTETFPQQAKMHRVYTGALLANLQKMKGFHLW